jgi:hypothetical protein
MIEHKKIIKFTEIFLIIFVWLVLLITPVFFKEENNNPILGSVLKQLEILIPLSLLFVINRFLLVPTLLFRGKQFTYVLSVLVIIGMLVVGLYFYHNSFGEGPNPFRQPPNISKRNTDNPPRPEKDQPDNSQQPGNRVPRPVPPYANFLILSFLVVGFDTGLRATLRWTEVEQEKVRLEKEFVATQLVILRNQISPHFFMNTLNNIHSLVDINTEEAKEAIIKLSKMMRYLLYETETEKTTLKKEIEFLESYVNLMKLRYNEKVSITLNFPTTIPDKSLPPFLFTSIIENSFKHGISYKNESFISIDMTLGSDRLLLVVKNSKADNKQIDDYSGIGIENTKKRLNLLYGKNYHLEIIDSEELFIVNLSIPL